MATWTGDERGRVATFRAPAVSFEHGVLSADSRGGLTHWSLDGGSRRHDWPGRIHTLSSQGTEHALVVGTELSGLLHGATGDARFLTEDCRPHPFSATDYAALDDSYFFLRGAPHYDLVEWVGDAVVASASLSKGWFVAPVGVYVWGRRLYLQCPQEGLWAVVEQSGLDLTTLDSIGTLFGFLDGQGEALVLDDSGSSCIKIDGAHAQVTRTIPRYPPVLLQRPSVCTHVAACRKIASSNIDKLFADRFVLRGGAAAPFPIWSGLTDDGRIVAVHEDGLLRLWTADR